MMLMMTRRHCGGGDEAMMAVATKTDAEDEPNQETDSNAALILI